MTKAKNILLSFILLSFTNLFGQIDTDKRLAIRQYAFKIDTTLKYIDSFKFTLDTTQNNIKIYTNKVVATSFFKKSKSILTTSYYLKDRQIIFISVKEVSPKFDNMYYESQFYYKQGKQFDETYSSTVMPDMLEPKNKSVYEIYGYNYYLNSDFLKKFVFVLYEKIKTTANMGFAAMLADE